MMKSPKSRPGLLLAGATGAAVGTAITIAIYGIGRAAGVAYVVTRTTRVRLTDVVLLSAGSFAIGLAAAAVAVRWGRRGLRVLQIVGAVLAVVSTAGDFTIDGTRAATATLMLMHLVIGISYLATLEVERSPDPSRGHGRRRTTMPLRPDLVGPVPRSSTS